MQVKFLGMRSGEPPFPRQTKISVISLIQIFLRPHTNYFLCTGTVHCYYKFSTSILCPAEATPSVRAVSWFTSYSSTSYCCVFTQQAVK